MSINVSANRAMLTLQSVVSVNGLHAPGLRGQSEIATDLVFPMLILRVYKDIGAVPENVAPCTIYPFLLVLSVKSE